MKKFYPGKNLYHHERFEYNSQVYEVFGQFILIRRAVEYKRRIGGKIFETLEFWGKYYVVKKVRK